MKKLMSIFAACLFVFALASCGAEGDASGSGSDASGSEASASAADAS
jgi:hypothetical protein